MSPLLMVTQKTPFYTFALCRYDSLMVRRFAAPSHCPCKYDTAMNIPLQGFSFDRAVYSNVPGVALYDYPVLSAKMSSVFWAVNLFVQDTK